MHHHSDLECESYPISGTINLVQAIDDIVMLHIPSYIGKSIKQYRPRTCWAPLSQSPWNDVRIYHRGRIFWMISLRLLFHSSTTIWFENQVFCWCLTPELNLELIAGVEWSLTLLADKYRATFCIWEACLLPLCIHVHQLLMKVPEQTVYVDLQDGMSGNMPVDLVTGNRSGGIKVSWCPIWGLHKETSGASLESSIQPTDIVSGLNQINIWGQQLPSPETCIDRS